MFEGFANVWTPVELARRVGRKPLAVRVAGERVVLFRGPDRAVRALSDRCPHRGVALSLGRVTPEGCLECPFHGWCFRGDGGCERVPLNPEAKRDQLSATAFPVRELGGLVWLYTAPGSRAPSEPVVSSALTDPRFSTYLLIKPWNAHWTRAMENMLDTPHLPFVHRRTIGAGLRKAMRQDSVMQVGCFDSEQGMRVTWELDGVNAEGAWLDFTRPNGMVLNVPIPGRLLRLHVWCVPAEPGKTRMVVASARNFGRWNPLARLFDQANRYIVHEDQAVVESSDPPEVPPPAREKSVASDRATLKFRRYYFDVLKPSSAAEPQPLSLDQPNRSSQAA